MSEPPIDDQELSEILRRATEIEAQTELLIEPNQTLKSVVEAAEEAGVSRDATLQALRERIGTPLLRLEPGQHVFAKSADRCYYVAVVGASTSHHAEVRFMNGSTHQCGVDEIRPFSLTPGQKVQVYSSGFWWDAAVQRVNLDARSVTVDQWGTQQVQSFEHVRLKPEGRLLDRGHRARLALVALGAALAGGTLGAIVTFLLTR